MNRVTELIGFLAIVSIGLLVVVPPLGIFFIGFVLPFLLPVVLVASVLGAMAFNIRGWLERKLDAYD